MRSQRRRIVAIGPLEPAAFEVYAHPDPRRRRAAIDADVPVLHRDGDFDVLARHTELDIVG